jgi:MFS family permease
MASTNARGLMSGILQQGYSFGYVLAACANLGVGDATESWKTVFWVGAGFSIFIGLVRMAFPESQQFIEAKKAGHKTKAPGAFWAETKKMLKAEWRMCVYCIFLMTWVRPPPILMDDKTALTITSSSTSTPTLARTATLHS